MSQLTNRFSNILILLAMLWIIGLSYSFSAPFGLNGLAREKTGDWFFGYAFNILDGHGYVDCEPDRKDAFSVKCESKLDRYAYRLPGYPVYLLGHVIVFGKNNIVTVVRLSQMLMAIAIIWIGSIFTRRLAGKLASVIFALTFAFGSPMFADYTSLIMAETFFTFLLVCFAYSFTFAQKHFLWIGALWGCILLTRGNFLLATPILLFLAKQKISFGIGLSIPLGLWMIRNLIVLGAIIPFSTGSGIVLLGTNNASTDGTYWINMERIPTWFDIINLPELAQDRSAQQIALEYFFQQPNAVNIILRRAATAFFNPVMDNNIFEMITLFVYIVLCIILIFLWRPRRGQRFKPSDELRRAILLTASLGISLIVNAMIFYGASRFRIPLDPLFFSICSVFLVLGRQRWRNRSGVTVMPPSA